MISNYDKDDNKRDMINQTSVSKLFLRSLHVLGIIAYTLLENINNKDKIVGLFWYSSSSSV